MRPLETGAGKQLNPEELAGLSLSDAERADLEMMLGRESEFSSTLSPSSNSSEDEEIEVSRKTPLRFPSKDSGGRVPRSLVLWGHRGNNKGGEVLVKEQAEEMVRWMRRGVVMYEYEKNERDVDVFSESEERVTSHEIGEGEEDEGKVVGRWIEEVD